MQTLCVCVCVCLCVCVCQRNNGVSLWSAGEHYCYTTIGICHTLLDSKSAGEFFITDYDIIATLSVFSLDDTTCNTVHMV